VITILLIGAITILGTSPAPAQAPPFCLPCVIQAVLATISVTIVSFRGGCAPYFSGK
jgi:hypothetical protein